MTLKTEKFIRKVRPVEAVKITEENIIEVATWCGGLHIPAPGLTGETNKQDYIHVAVSNPNSPTGNRAFPDSWLVREDFRRYRIVTNKVFKNSYEPLEKPKPAAPKPTAMPAKKISVGPDASQAAEPVQVGAVEVVPGTAPDEGSPLTTGTVSPEAIVEETIGDDGLTDAERVEYAALEAEEAKPKLGENDGRTTVSEMIEKDKEDAVESEHVSDQDAEESATPDDVMHGDAMADAEPAEDIVPGDMNDPIQPEADADGTVQLGAPLESPELCGSCGSVVVDGVCSNDIKHDVFGTAEGSSEPDALPGD